MYSEDFEADAINNSSRVDRFDRFPGTRYMGSKNRILNEIWGHLKSLKFESVLDAFAGSNVLSYFLKCREKRVITNDFLRFSHLTSKALIENSTDILDLADIQFLISKNTKSSFIQDTFRNIFFSDEENAFLDRVRANISSLDSEYTKALALAALTRACIKKRSRGIFTFVGERYDDGRKDMQKSIETHFLESIAMFNDAVFDNGKDNRSLHGRTEELDIKADLVYLDPPYYSRKSDNDYVRRYHFVEGLSRNWEDLEIQEQSAVKKFKSYYSPFSKKESAYSAFDNLFDRFKESIIVVSYSSNCLPTKAEIEEMLRNYKESVICHEIDLTYSIGNQGHKIGNKSNRVKEYLFIAQ